MRTASRMNPAGCRSRIIRSKNTRRAVNYACAAIPLAELGNPWAVYLGATVEVSGQVVDKSAWQMIYTGMP